MRLLTMVHQANGDEAGWQRVGRVECVIRSHDLDHRRCHYGALGRRGGALREQVTGYREYDRTRGHGERANVRHGLEAKHGKILSLMNCCVQRVSNGHHGTTIGANQLTDLVITACPHPRSWHGLVTPSRRAPTRV